MNRGINNIHITLNISKLKQQIASLQNQIAQQQAAYVNKQPGGNHNMGGNGEFNLFQSTKNVSSDLHYSDIVERERSPRVAKKIQILFRITLKW